MAGRPKTVFIIGILAVAVAAFASISLYRYLKGIKEAATTVKTEKVVVASVEIPVGNSINTTQVKTIDWPKGNVPQGSFSSADQVVGRITLDRYTPDEPIVEAKLVPRQGQAGVLSYKIPEGHRAMTVAVDQVAGVAGFITPGNKVDVVLTTTPPGAPQPLSKIVLQNMPVLATGQIVEQQKEGKPNIVPTVTMDVTPDDAEKLSIASTQGRLQLVLKRAGDTEVVQTTGATVTKVIGTSFKAEMPAAPAKVAKPAKKAKAVKEEKVEKPVERVKPEEAVKVEVWRSNQKSIETFKGE